jgi:hypothetical protein
MGFAQNRQNDLHETQRGCGRSTPYRGPKRCRGLMIFFYFCRAFFADIKNKKIIRFEIKTLKQSDFNFGKFFFDHPLLKNNYS